MKKLSSGFINEEVLFLGYSSKNKAMCHNIYEAFKKNGIEVYAMNTNKNASHDIKVYQSFDALPKVAKTAYVLLSKDNTEAAIKELIERKVTKILIHNKKIVSEETIQFCNTKGVEIEFGCPLMLFGSGIHKFHGFISGIK